MIGIIYMLKGWGEEGCVCESGSGALEYWNE